MQILGTALELIGAIITLGGLLYAWYALSGRLNQWRKAASSRLTQLRNSVDSWVDNFADSWGRRPIPGLSLKRSLRDSIVFGMEAQGLQGGTPDRLARLENELVGLADQVKHLTSTLRDDIDAAIATEREESNAVQLRDLYPALVGIVVSMAGLICQLVG